MLYTPTGLHTYEEEIKKSNFIVNIAPVLSPEEALDFIKEISDSDARHNCWCYKIGQTYRFSDDGEPSGTAGKPMYSAVENNNFDNMVAVVTRFFGGIKLGAGGLIRAYSGVTSRCIQECSYKEIIHYREIKFKVPFNLSSTVYHYISVEKIIKIEESYDSDGPIISIKVEESEEEKTKKDLVELTNGIVKIVNI